MLETDRPHASGPGADTSAGNGDGVAQQAGQKAQEAAAQAQEKAQQAAGQMQQRLREQLDERSSQAGQQIDERASDLRSVSDALRQQGKDGPARAAEQLAGYAERAGRYLREKDSQAVLADVETLGRRQPLAVVAGGLSLGLAASRFLKASSRQRYQSLTVPRPNGVHTQRPAPQTLGAPPTAAHEAPTQALV